MFISINSKSFLKGIKTIEKPLHFFKPEYWRFHFHKNYPIHIHFWTPSWHNGRGPLIILFLRYFSITRGYDKF